MSGRGIPDPAFVSALAVFSKGLAFAIEVRKWSRQGPSREALAWLLAPLASLWWLLEGKLAAKTASKIKENSKRKFVTKIIENSYRGLENLVRF